MLSKQLHPAIARIARQTRVDVDAANRLAAERMLQSRPQIIGVGRALDVVPGMRPDLVLHAGPPVTWERMCGPLRGAVIGGLVYEGLATTREEAEKLAASGAITFEPCHHHDAVGPMAGVMTSRMPVWIFENATFGNRAYCTFNEGLGKVLRYGAFSDEVLAKLRWLETDLAPVMSKALAAHGPIDMRGLIAQVLQMGDEGHNRNRAGTSLLIRELAPFLVMLDEPRERIAAVLSFMHANDHFFLNLTMPASKCTVDAARGIEGSSVITTMARNGTDFGIRVSGLGDRWFTGPAGIVGPGDLVCRWNLQRGLRYSQARESWAPFDRIQAADGPTRQTLVTLIEATLGAGHHVYLTINNKAEGSAPASLLALVMTLLERRFGKDPGKEKGP